MEMVAVLVVLAILTHLAVVQNGHVVRDRRNQAAAKMMGDIEEAVRNFQRDVGRLPRAVTNELGNLTLGELWERPEGIADYRLVSMDFNGTPAAGGPVMIGRGWRGPYLKLPVGRTRLFDPWGNPMEVPAEGAGELPARLFTVDGANTNVAARGDLIGIVAHYGADGLNGDQSDSVDGSVSFDAAESSSLGVYVRFKDEQDAYVAADAVVRCFFVDASVDGNVSFKEGVASGSPVVFDGLPLGPKVVVVMPPVGLASQWRPQVIPVAETSVATIDAVIRIASNVSSEK